METIDNKDRQPTLFIGDRERVFFQRVATEAIECVTQQKITYFAIEGSLSRTDDFYGESTSKVFRTPIQLYALILYNSPLVETGTFSTETRYSLKCYIQKFRIEQDLKMTPRIGDYISFAQKYFEIVKVFEPQLIAGSDEPGFKMGCVIEAITTRSGTFSPQKKTPSDPSINPDVIR